MEIREKGAEFLREELRRAQKELKLKDAECERLCRVREQLERELEELTASLFEVRGGPQNGAGGQREAGGSREAAKGGAGQDRHAAGGGDCPEDPGHHVHAGLPQSRAASATAEPHQGWAPQRTLAAPELQQGPGPHRAPCPRARPRAGQGGQGGRHHAVLRVPGLEGSAHTGQGLPLPGQGVPRGCGPLPGLHHARALCAGAGCRGGQHAHHRASGLTHAAWHEGRCGVWPHQCALSGLTSPCRHRIRLGDSESHYYISPSSRARITAVCNFFTYIRYIQQGLVRQDVEPMFWEVMRLRKEMSLAKLGFFPQEG
ncbi:guanine nucleotide exchange factor for Rab-3A isoform X10 [Fukomys damarensis]|uniref:guanine nucleotide exchange factor for Rab-3A isoform X10 n=1 Tax=Fukomys damarensis TaxID=885580 RepID=UPI001455D5B9|nr:guanine nucleotide exchange factor for Rab-3A isoform X10 [Fukomys damarensis]